MSSAQPSITLDDTPAIYAANLHAYNSGRLVGEWIKIEDGMTADDISERIQAMIAKTGGEEYAIHDYDNMPTTLGEWPDLETVAAVAQAVHDHGFEPIKAYIDYFGADSLDQFEERYQGEHSSEEDFARQLVDDIYNLDKMMGSLAHYFDYEAFARDLFMGDYTSADVSGGVVVFRAD